MRVRQLPHRTHGMGETSETSAPSGMAERGMIPGFQIFEH